MNRLRILPALPILLALGMCLIWPGAAPSAGAGEPQATAPAGGSESPPGAAVFTMKYRALSTPDDPLSYRSFWGFGSSGGENDPFVLAVKSRIQESAIVYNRSFVGAPWSVVELKDKKPVAFYFDLNGDGRLSDNEKFLPAAATGARSPYPYTFITSDFTLHARDQRETPFRAMLVAMQNGPDSFSYMWSPACVLEGQGTLAGVPMRLILYTNGFNGSFTTFGACRYALLESQPAPERYLPQYPLSSLIQHKGTFYRLKLEDTPGKDCLVRATFEKDTTPTGQLAVTVAGQESLRARVGPATVTGATGNSIYFNLPDLKSPLPEGRYRLSSGMLGYGAQKDDEWRVTFNEGPAFEIAAGQTKQVEMGKPALTIHAVKESERYNGNVQEHSTFTKGTPIYLDFQIKGKAGEVYTRFSQNRGGLGRFADAKPHVTIVDSAGKQVVSTDMEYG